MDRYFEHTYGKTIFVNEFWDILIDADVANNCDYNTVLSLVGLGLSRMAIVSDQLGRQDICQKYIDKAVNLKQQMMAHGIMEADDGKH